MRNPRSLVTGLTAAKRLEEVGFPQDTHFHWTAELEGRQQKLKNWKVKHLDPFPPKFHRGAVLATPTDTEVLILLPRTLRKNRMILRLDIIVRLKGYAIGYKTQGTEGKAHYEIGNTIGEAASSLYCYLKKNNLL